MERISGIYKITSPDNKIYIGMSSDINSRWHFYKTLRCVSQKLLYNSFMNYGVLNHIFEIVELCDVDNLPNKEIYYIEKFNSYKSDSGLNMTKGGKCGRPPKIKNETNQKDRFTERQTVMISPIQAKSLSILKSYDVNVSQFIRQAIKEKLHRDWKEIKEAKTKLNLPF